MESGRLNRRIVIEYPAENTESKFGTKVATWLPLDVSADSSEISIPAEVQDFLPSRSESVRQGLAIARNQTRVRIRWRSDITSKMRIRLLGETDTYYQIVGGPAEIDGRKSGLEMVCERFSSQ